jgi:hypothetical protein
LVVNPFVERAVEAILENVASLDEDLNVDHGPSLSFESPVSLTAKENVDMAESSLLSSEPILHIPYTDKFSGSFDFEDGICVGASGVVYHKLVPEADISNTGFVDEVGGSGLFSSVDEGVITGPYHVNGETGSIVSDESTYIETTGGTEGLYSYKCKISSPQTWLKNSRLHMRAAIPFADLPMLTPKYEVTNLILKDPSGNVIVQYKDFTIRGDSEFTTYGSEPLVNNAGEYQWDSLHPDLWSAGDFTFEFSVQAISLNDPFSNGFNFGYEDTIDNIPPDGHPLQITAIEISSKTSGQVSCGIGPGLEDYIQIYADVQEIGNRIKRPIHALGIKTTSFDTGVWPEVYSTWNGHDIDDVTVYDNTTESGAMMLTDFINSEDKYKYIELPSASPSGKLTVTFGHETPNTSFGLINGAFSMGVTPDGAYDTARRGINTPVDNFFKVDTVSLRILARKKVGEADYPIDVVGYSDDKLLHITPAVGGFLQNPTGGTGTIPSGSGIVPNDALALDGEPVSSLDEISQDEPVTSQPGGDHYELSAAVVNNTGAFVWYDIPLEVQLDDPEIGEIVDYSQSSFFEKIILDIYPFSEGAEIAYMELCVFHAPSNALNLHSLGGDTIGYLPSGRSEGQIYPSTKTDDEIINAGTSYGPLSTIEDIPHAYTTPASIKSNYARRWRGKVGADNGAFDPNPFDFSFEAPLLDYPFLEGFYNFSKDSGTSVNPIPRDGKTDNVGTLTSSYGTPREQNIGWRFKTGDIFDTKLPTYSSTYKTIDWTSLVDGGSNFTADPLYGQISDAFDTYLRMADADTVTFGAVDSADGFSVYIRFSPDSDATYNDQILVSKWDSDANGEFIVGIKNSKIFATLRESGGGETQIDDTVNYDAYAYPLSVIVTFNDQNSGKLKLYTDNELYDGEWTTLRASSAVITKNVANSVLTLGHNSTKSLGMDMFVTEFGYSTYGASGTNIVESTPDRLYREVTAQEFLENNRVKWWSSGDTVDSYKLWSYVDEDTNEWTMGEFSVCEFGPSFERLTNRVGADLISFVLDHDGSSYSSTVDTAIPSTINEDVAYHTQVENDFLRFNLSDTGNTMHSVPPRISKDLPRGYDFNEDAIVVDSIIDHASSGTIVWPDGQEGAKLIVSLYTRNKDPYYTPEYGNWGLINRESHYLKEDQCFITLQSKFTLESTCDESEAWALFPDDQRLTEFNHKFFSQDIDDMFLQYDMVYPSGSPISSRMNLHSSHIRLEQLLITEEMASGHMNMMVCYACTSHAFWRQY